MPDIHAKLCSPSGAEGWFACPGRIVMEAPFPDDGNQASNDGTARHDVVANCLVNPGESVTDYVGREIGVHGKIVTYKADWVAEDQDYVDTFRALGAGADMFVERVVNFERYTQVKGDSFGTADVVILKPLADLTYELIVGDRKTGYHEVPVERNKQLQLYALGAYDEYSLVYDISRVRLIIHQRSAREWDCPVEELLQFAQEARSRAITVVNAVSMHGKVDQAEWEATFLNANPSEDACRYCKAMATCPSMQRAVQEIVGTDFETLASADGAGLPKMLPLFDQERLDQMMAGTPVLELFVKAIRAEMERRLLAGVNSKSFGLELGRQGAREWADAAAAEAKLKAMRLKVEEMYDLSLISPTTAEKLADTTLVTPPKSKKKAEATPSADKAIGPRQWVALQGLIRRSPPKPSVKPLAEIKTPYVPAAVADDFDTVAETTDLA